MSGNRDKHRGLRGNILLTAVTVIFGCAAIVTSIMLLRLTPAAKPTLSAGAQRTSSSAPSTSSVSSSQTTSSTSSETSSAASSSTSSATSSAASPVSLESALFLGDSFIDGLRIYGGVEDLQTICDNNMSAYSAVNRKYKIGTKSQKVADAAAEKDPSAIYIMLGSNDISQGYSASKFKNNYGKLIESLKKECPNAKIYVQSILPVTSAYDKKQRALNNETIEKFNSELSQLCSEYGVTYLDVASALKDADGCLPSEASSDGLHLKKAYYKKWVSYLESNG